MWLFNKKKYCDFYLVFYEVIELLQLFWILILIPAFYISERFALEQNLVHVLSLPLHFTSSTLVSIEGYKSTSEIYAKTIQ